MKNIRMEVLLIMSHLIITIAILFIYMYTIHSGNADETLKTILTVVIGYWFGSLGIAQVRNKKEEDEKNEEDNEPKKGA